MKISVRASMAPGSRLAEKLSALTELGYDGIELHGDVLELSDDELARHFAGSPVQPSAMVGSLQLLNPTAAVRQEGLAEMRARLATAKRLGAAGVIIVPTFATRPELPNLWPLTDPLKLQWDLLVAELKLIAPDYEAAGIPILIEPLNRYETHFINRLEQGCRMCDEVGSAGCKIMADFFHMNIEEPDIAASIRAAKAHLAYIHVADSIRLQPGTGHIDLRPGFRALKDIGYDGWLGLECGLTEPKDAALREALELVKREWEAA